MREHTREVHNDCEYPNCPICDGGLFHCTVCGLAEGSLTTECCGEKVSLSTEEQVYNGEINFRNGRWVQLCEF